MDTWISSLKMDEANSITHSYMNSLDQDKFLTEVVLEPLNFSFQSLPHHHHHHHNSSTMSPYNNDNSSTNVFSTTTTMGSSSLSYEDARFDERHGKMLKSTSSSSIISQDVANNASSSYSSAPSSSTFILSFENSTMKPALHDKPNENGNSSNHFGGDATCSSLLNSENGHLTKPKPKQGAKKYRRSSSEIQDHILAERKRRQELTERFIALSATIPGLKKTDKAYILREAIIYMKQLQERVKELENQNKRKTAEDSIILVKKYSQVCSREEETSSSEQTKTHRSTPPLPHVEARVLEKEVLIGIHCHKQKDIVLKIMALLQNHHLSLASSSVLPFGTSTLKVTIIAQMGEKFSTTVNDLVKCLRQILLKT